jgi:hypothetical protein
MSKKINLDLLYTNKELMRRKGPEIIKIFEQLWGIQADEITKERIEMALITGTLPTDVTSAIDLSFITFLNEIYKPLLQNIMIDASLGTIKFPGLMSEVNQKHEINQIFDVSTFAVQDWLIYESSNLIVQMAETEKEAIRSLFSRAINEKWGVTRTVDELKGGISLFDKWNDAVIKRYDDVYEAELKRFLTDPDLNYSLAAAEKAAKANAERARDGYRSSLQKTRARTIARTELNRAKMETEKQCIDQLIESGKIKGSKKRWVRHGTTDPWPSSEINDGMITGWVDHDFAYTIPEGSTMQSNQYPCEINERCGLERQIEV